MKKARAAALAYVTDYFHEALDRVLDELIYDPASDDSRDDHGCVRPDICAHFFERPERERLVAAVRLVGRALPFPKLCREPLGRLVLAPPAFDSLCRLFEQATGAIPRDVQLEGFDELDHLEIAARALALRSGLLRLSAELTAFKLFLAKEEHRRRTGRGRRRASYREQLLEVAHSEFQRLAEAS